MLFCVEDLIIHSGFTDEAAKAENEEIISLQVTQWGMSEAVSESRHSAWVPASWYLASLQAIPTLGSAEILDLNRRLDYFLLAGIFEQTT